MAKTTGDPRIDVPKAMMWLCLKAAAACLVIFVVGEILLSAVDLSHISRPLAATCVYAVRYALGFGVVLGVISLIFWYQAYHAGRN